MILSRRNTRRSGWVRLWWKCNLIVSDERVALISIQDKRCTLSAIIRINLAFATTNVLNKLLHKDNKLLENCCVKWVLVESLDVWPFNRTAFKVYAFKYSLSNKTIIFCFSLHTFSFSPNVSFDAQCVFFGCESRTPHMMEGINKQYFLAHFCRRLLAQQFLDTAGSEQVNKKQTRRFLGCPARVLAKCRQTERFPRKA